MLVLLDILLLLLIANGAPILAYHLFRGRGRYPVDGGKRLADGQRLFGDSKSVLGIIAAIVMTTAAAAGLGYGWLIGVLVGAGAMAGDLLTSFIKRRRGIRPSGYAAGLDQFFEALLPLLLLMPLLSLRLAEVLLLVALFIALDLALSRVLYKLRWRRQPY